MQASEWMGSIPQDSGAGMELALACEGPPPPPLAAAAAFLLDGATAPWSPSLKMPPNMLSILDFCTISAMVSLASVCSRLLLAWLLSRKGYPQKLNPLAPADAFCLQTM